MSKPATILFQVNDAELQILESGCQHTAKYISDMAWGTKDEGEKARAYAAAEEVRALGKRVQLARKRVKRAELVKRARAASAP